MLEEEKSYLKIKRKSFWRYNEPLNQLLLSAYHLKEENLQYYIQKLNNFKPETLDGYTTALHRIAKYILDNEIKLDFKPIAIFPTAEALTDEMKRDIEKHLLVQLEISMHLLKEHRL